MTSPSPQSSPSSDDAEPRIIVDADWKAQAQAEKERLAQQQASAAAASGSAGTGRAAGPDAPPTPFIGLLASLATQALLYLGGVADPETGRAVVAPDHARHYIDMLGALQEKTKGNLTREEQDELDGILSELRMRFVQIVGRLDELAAQQEKQAGDDQATGSREVKEDIDTSKFGD